MFLKRKREGKKRQVVFFRKTNSQHKESVTVEKKEGKLKKHKDVTIMDLPGIYSLSPYTLEEVVARNYLVGERPDVWRGF